MRMSSSLSSKTDNKAQRHAMTSPQFALEYAYVDMKDNQTAICIIIHKYAYNR